MPVAKGELIFHCGGILLFNLPGDRTTTRSMYSPSYPKSGVTRRRLLKYLGIAPAAARWVSLAGSFLPREAFSEQPSYPSEVDFHEPRLQPHYPSKSPLESVLRLVAPGRDEFFTEKYAAEIDSILQNLSKELQSAAPGLSALKNVFDSSFSGTGLHVVQEKTLSSNAGLELIERKFASDGVGPDGFLHGFEAYLGGMHVETAEFQIVLIQQASETPLTAHAEIRYDFVLAKGQNQREQRIGTWTTEWIATGQGRWAVRNWSTAEERVARFHGYGFEDVTSAALGHTESYRQQLLRGGDYWRSVLDGACGIDVYGNNGIAVGDFDNDGFDDMYVCQPAGLPNRLYRNRGDGTFDDVSESSGVNLLDGTACALFADFDNRGLQDLLVVCASGPLFFRNTGAGKFALAPNAFRFAQPPQGAFTHAALADYDNDGHLDIYLCTYSYYVGLDQYHYPIPYFDARNGPANILMHNEGNGIFVERTRETGLDAENDRYSFACAWNDFDGDGHPDLLVANDFGRPNLYRNNGNGTFTAISEEAHVSEVGAGMSAAWGDIDNDGNPDAYIANMWSAAGERVSTQKQFHPEASAEIRKLYLRHARGNSVFHNTGKGVFEDASESSGASMGRWSWCSDFLDFDHSGWMGLYIANGYISAPDRGDLGSFFWRQVVGKSPNDATPSQTYEHGWGALNELIRADGTWSGYERNVLYANDGKGQFFEVSGVLGLDFVEDSRSFALADLDGDGRMEIVLKNRNAPQLRILHNRNAQIGNSIIVRLRGTRSNRDAVGATLTLRCGQLQQTKQLQAGSGFLAQHSKEVHFGLGAAPERIDLSVRWPMGATQHFSDLPANHRIELVEGSDKYKANPFAKTATAFENAVPQRIPDPYPATAETWLLQPIKAPGFSLNDVAGAPHSLEKLSGNLIALAFCDVSSNLSLRQLAHFAEAVSAARSSDLSFIAVHCESGGQKSSTEADIRKQNLPYPVLFANDEVAGQYNIIYRYLFDRRRDLGFPTTFLLDREGMIVKVYQGVVEAGRIIDDAASIPTHPQDRVRKALPFAGPLYQDAIQRNDFTYGVAFFQHGYLDQAEASFRQVIAAKPDDPEAYYNLGTLSLRRNDLSNAQSYLNKAIELRPEYPEAWNNLGMLAAQQNNPQEAIRNFLKSIQLRPSYVIAYLNLGNVYRRQGQADKALEYLTQAIKLQPDDPEIYYNLGMLYAREGQSDLAADNLNKAIALRPEYAEARNNLGVLYVRNKNYDKAEEQFKACVQIVPDFDQSYLNLARLYVLEGKRDQAREVLQSLLQHQPENGAAKQALQMLASNP
ncbi:FG-GAP-like repeat-containing protein [Acidicapsa dinghuensis]|uniref:FG-GAP-like repeat-containing protein n=1 Tax=Acidicapsa dinghuensis TaxID=2218256 RepID=A0ABW1EKC2_9BACT|nr:FG-GAP-like repeat-containing protein [Acidicapsa dinghuensis]